MTIRQLARGIIATAALAIAACGGGGDGGIGGTGGGGGGGVAGSDVAYGTITAFGSVWVNGIEFSSSGTTIKIDDNTVPDQSSLRVGMVVRIDGSIANKTASTINVDDAIKGRVEQVIDANQIRVMGQLVQIDNLTRFENGVVPAAGDIVDVHGTVAGDGVIAASFIEKKASLATPPFAVKGTVKNHVIGTSFQVGTLTVNYAGAITSDMPAGTWNGLQVDVKGTACAGNPVCGTLTASKVEPAGAVVATAAQAEIEGIVSSLSGANFSIGNQAVVTTASTRYEGGLAGDIALGTKLEAEGAIANGVLTAVKVSFRDAVRLEGDVASVGGGNFTVTGLPGVTVSVNSLTQYKGSNTFTSLANLAVPNHVRVRGRPGTGGGMVATEVELRSTSADTRVELQAAASAVVPSTSVTLQGIVVNTATVSQFRDATGASISSAAFYAAAKVGTLIKVRGTRGAGGAVTWDQAELES